MIKVMHVDADAAVREMVDMVLCLTGEFVVMPCEDGAEALSQLSVFGPEVILIDTVEAHRDGAATIAAIHASPEFRETPVIFVTPEEANADTAALRAAGAADVIAKPFDPMELAGRIKDALPTHV